MATSNKVDTAAAVVEEFPQTCLCGAKIPFSLPWCKNCELRRELGLPISLIELEPEPTLYQVATRKMLFMEWIREAAERCASCDRNLLPDGDCDWCANH